MKNLFKNLMLVAVAAMAFTACTETNDEVNAVSKITRYEFTANIADETRSGFAEKEEGATAYKSEWHDGDEIKLFVTDNISYNVVETAPISADGKFTLELTDAPESFNMIVCSPAESWTNKNGYIEYIIPTEQAPLANSVDPKAHLLQSQNVSVSNGVAAEAINMTHQVAYGKMTVNGVDFAIDHVVVDLKGTFYGDREYSYTINADNVENNTFWFATQPIDVAEFTVTAYDEEDNAVAKTVDVVAAGKTMSFSYGRVGTFSVSGLKTPAKPDTVMDSAKYYYDYNDYGGFENWGYVVFEDEFLGTLVINFQFKDGLYLKKGAYDAYTDGQRYDTGYSYYNVVGSNPFSFAYYWDYDHVVNVDVVDGKYSIVFDVKNQNGDILNATYVGDIDGLGYPDQPDQPDQPGGDSGEVPDGYIAVEYVSATTGSYKGYTYNWIGDFTFNYQGEDITFTMCDFNGPMQIQNKNVKAGVYTNNGKGANASSMELYNISIAGMSGDLGSTVEVSKDGADYVFKMTMITVGGTFNFYYKGAL